MHMFRNVPFHAWSQTRPFTKFQKSTQTFLSIQVEIELSEVLSKSSSSFTCHVIKFWIKYFYQINLTTDYYVPLFTDQLIQILTKSSSSHFGFNLKGQIKFKICKKLIRKITRKFTKSKFTNDKSYKIPGPNISSFNFAS